VREKFEAHEAMKAEMKLAALELMKEETPEVNNTEIEQISGDRWTIYNGDCVRVAKEFIASDSVGFSIFSPPFADLFTYSDRDEDMGNCSGLDEFMQHFRFLIDELQRVTMPGRLCAVHCCDLLATKWKHGSMHLQDFTRVIEEAFCGDPDDFLQYASSSLMQSTAKYFKKTGWLLHSKVTIWKDPVTEMQRTKAHGLLYKTLKKDSSHSRVGCPDYVLVFKKLGTNETPIENAPESFDLDDWQKIASPVWMDIEQGNVLNRKGSKEQGDERHICPLQLDVIERALRLWSAPSDLVYSPFTGIGSEAYQSVKMGRRFVGSELKASYFKDACLWSKMAESEQDLFALK
jgi:DNA modification methylase